jgi:hypothetical protein
VPQGVGASDSIVDAAKLLGIDGELQKFADHMREVVVSRERETTTMATIEPYGTKAGKRYRVRYRTPGRGQTDKRGFKTKRDAERFAASVEVSKMRGEYVSPSSGRVTIGELGSAWLQRQRGHLKPPGYVVMKTAWRVRVRPRWGNVAIGDIRPTGVQHWLAELSRGTADVKPVEASVVKRALRLVGDHGRCDA